ncbi:conserved hypothetical protein [Synechococcus sp. CC9605]|nr:conserved hypothetical protein [Synechococcus sp. CC9605]
MWCRRVGGGADSALGVARQAVLFPPSLEAQNLPRPARHHHKKFSVIRVDGVTFNVTKDASDLMTAVCRASNCTPAQLIFETGTAEEIEAIRSAAAKAKGSN